MQKGRFQKHISIWELQPIFLQIWGETLFTSVWRCWTEHQPQFCYIFCCFKKKMEWAEWDMKLLHIKGRSTQVMSENQFFKEMKIQSIFGIQFCNYIQFCCCFSHTHQYSQCGSPSFSGNIYRMENMAISCPSKHLKIQVMIPNYLKILLLVWRSASL